MRRKLIIAMGVILISFSCEDTGGISGCVRGRVIGSEHCSNVMLIQLDKRYPLGRRIQYYDGSTYENVVRTPRAFTEGDTTLYFRFREYDEEKDSELLISPYYCLAVYGPFEVPTYVVTYSSAQSCN